MDGILIFIILLFSLIGAFPEEKKRSFVVGNIEKIEGKHGRQRTD